LAIEVCSHPKNVGGEIVRSVRVRVATAEFSGAMMAIAEWFDANGYEPTRYKYTQRRDAVFVTIDLPSAVAANAFALRFYQQFSNWHCRGYRQLTPCRTF